MGGPEKATTCQIGCHRGCIPSTWVSSMADDAIHALICLVEGDSSVFIVEPTGDMDIMDLKDLIWEENKNNVLNGVDSKDLILWKVMSL